MSNFFVFMIAVAAVVALVWWYRQSRDKDRFSVLMAAHPNAAIRSRAQLIDGANHIVVALSLDRQQISYQNVDFDASLDLAQIDEVEYGSDLVTGGIADGAVLRLRAHGRAIEFVLDANSAEQWSRRLPPHRMGESGQVQIVPA